MVNGCYGGGQCNGGRIVTVTEVVKFNGGTMVIPLQRRSFLV